MQSNDEWFLCTTGIAIYNDRNRQDLAYVFDNEFSGMVKDSTYPNVYSGECTQDNLYQKKGDKVKAYYCRR